MNDAAKKITIVLDPCLDIRSSEAFLQEIRDAYSMHDAITLDASAVERFTTPAAQIMLSAFAMADEEGKTCAISSPSDVVTKAFEDFGLTEQIEKRVQ